MMVDQKKRQLKESRIRTINKNKMKRLILVVAIFAGSISAIGQGNVAHVNTQKLLDTMPSRKAAEVTLKDMEALYMSEIDQSQKSLQAEYEKYMATRETMSPTVRAYTEERLQKKQQELEGRQEELGQMLQKQSAEMNKPILERVQKAIKIVSERKKIDYVLEESQTLYFNPAKDVTKEVITELLKLEAEVSKNISPVAPK
jgi:outer membrane protein